MHLDLSGFLNWSGGASPPLGTKRIKVMSLNQTDTISCKYVFTKGDGFLPVFNDTTKLTHVKKMFHLIVNELTLKELEVTHYKVIDKGLKGITI